VIKWFGTPGTDAVRQAMRDGEFGAVITPAQGMYEGLEGVELVIDNGKFGQGYPGDVEFLAFMAQFPAPGQVRFAVAPDVVGDAAATLRLSAPFLPVIRALGYKVALAAQNGLVPEMVPWGAFDVLFLGGVSECLPCNFVKPPREFTWKVCPKCGRQLQEWKTSSTACALVEAAAEHGIESHMGRVNGPNRHAIADAMGCTTGDGTRLARGPDKNLPYVRSMIRKVTTQEVFAFGESA
jgi:hypothetical protein